MSKLNFINPIESMSGKDNQHSNRSKRIRNGKTFSYTWNTDNKEIISPAKTLQQYAMKLANLRATSILSNPEQRVALEEEFRHNNQYVELRPFVVAKLLREIKASVLAGDTQTINEMLDLVHQHPVRRTRDAKLAALSSFLPS